MSSAISVEQLSVRFRGRGRQPEILALDEIGFDLAKGRIAGILGPNGSGKTTLLRVLAGLQRPTSGRAVVLGEQPGDSSLRRRLGFQPAGEVPLGVLTAREYLAWTGVELGLANEVADERAADWLARLDLEGAADRRLGTYSTGMKRRLALCAALLGDPDVLLLDEPTSGLDPFGSAAVIEVLRERAGRGTAVLMASHHLLEVEELCDEVMMLHGGRLRARGTLDELLGTEARTLVVRDLDDDAIERLCRTAADLGGQVVRTEAERRHLFALFRDLARETSGDSGR